MSVKELATKGMIWNAIERFSSQGIQFVLTIVIARLLSPDDYALIAMLSIFMTVAQTFVDSGLSNALIQKKDRTELDYSTMFYANMGFSVILYLILFSAAPYIAVFYGQPSLTALLRVLGVQLITNSLGTIQMTRFTISLDFKKIAMASLISVVVSGSVGIWMAYHGCGAWTLVAQILVGNIVWALVLWIFARWIPSWNFSFSSFHTLFSFGIKLLFSNLIHTIYMNMYSLVIGKCYAASTLGYFNRAYTLGQFPVQNFSNIVQKVLYPIQCRYQEDDEKFNYIFSVYLRLSSYIIFPLMIGFAVLAEPLIRLLLTDKWQSAVPLLQILCISLMWLPVMQANVSVLDAKGRSDYHLRSEIIKKVAAVIILCITLQLGIEYVCIGVFVYSLLDMGVVIAYSSRLTKVGYRKQAILLLPSLLAATLMGSVVWVATFWIDSLIAKLLCGIPLGIFVYLALSYCFRFSELQTIYTLLKKGGL